MSADMLEKLRVEDADENHWDAVGPDEDAGCENSSVVVIRQVVEGASCEEAEDQRVSLSDTSRQRTSNLPFRNESAPDLQPWQDSERQGP
jgi:hypothetical protein